MRVQFLKDVTVDVWECSDVSTDKLLSRNTEIEVDEIVSTSNRFADLVLPSGNVLLDVRKDLFKVVVS